MTETRLVSAAGFLPSKLSLRSLGKAVRDCRGCDLYKNATHAVPGVGAATASIVLVGEQPGHQEDLQGLPFVGPAGKLLDRALADAGLDRTRIFVTEAVRHFRFEERGKRRIHKTPTRAQVIACRPWLESELELLRPRLIVCLGATAVFSVVGRALKVADLRGQVLPHHAAGGVTATVHPSFVLRVPQSQDEEYRRFVADLRFAGKFAG